MNSSALAAGLRNLRGQMAAQQRRDDSDEQLLNAFTSRRDDDAFAVLVRRHGPMVLHVCRRVLGHEQDAEDAFQATFLVLAQSAAALRKQAALASFLHGIAYRTAMKARRSAACRRKHEVRAPARPLADPADELSWQEVRTLLDDEIARLPEKYRSAFVLFHLEDLSREETARRLGLKDVTVKKRLTEARKRLAQRLSRRGVELSAVLAAVAVATPAASALPVGLVAPTIKAASATAAGEGLSGIVSTSVVELVQSAKAAMMVSKAKMAVLVLLIVATNGSLVGWYQRASGPLAATAEAPVAKTNVKPRTTTPKGAAINATAIQGRVLAADGTPKAGAKLLLYTEDKKVAELGVTVGDGRFSVAIPKETNGRFLIARADDCGFAIRWTGNMTAEKSVEMRLVKDQPIRGRVINTEGKPVAGVRVRVNDVHFFADNSLDAFLKHWKNRRGNENPLEGELQLRNTAGALFAATTDAEGRFVLRGIGVERFVSLHLSGGGIAHAESLIATRPGFDRKSFDKEMLNDRPEMQMKRGGRQWQLDGPDATIIVEMEKIIRGKVKEFDTEKGRPGVLVLLTRREGGDLLWPIAEARTDAQGRFEIHGARKAKRYMLEVGADTAAGFMPRQVWAEDTPGFSPIAADIEVKKGIVVTGVLTDGGTGKPIRGHVVIAALVDNPFVKDFPDFNSSAWLPFQRTRADGTFRLVSIPGPMLLMGQPDDYRSWRRFKPPSSDPKYPKYFRQDANFLAFYNPDGSMSPVQGIYCKVMKIKSDAEVVKQDIVLERAPVLPIRIQDGDGNALRGARVGGSSPKSWYADSVVHCKEADCPVYQLEPGKPRLLVFFHSERKLIGTLTLKGDEKKPVVAKLGPAGSMKGRLINAEGKPLSGMAVGVQYRQPAASDIHKIIPRPEQPVLTDRNGAFALDNLIPELKFELTFHHSKRRFEFETKPSDPSLQVKPGECRDLGAIKLK